MRYMFDLKESYEGDLIIEGEDLADTNGNSAMAAYQLIRTITNTPKNGFPLYPGYGTDLTAYVGSKNTAKVGYELARVIKQYIKSNSSFYTWEIEVEPFPTGFNTMAFRIRIISVPDNSDYYSIAFDMRDNNINSMMFDDTSVAISFQRQLVELQPTKNTRG